MKTCPFYTAAKQRACGLLFHSVHRWFHAVLTALSYFQHADRCLSLWEGEGAAKHAQCRSAPRASSPSPDKASDAGPGILQLFPWLFGDANKQEANWSRPQTPREPTRTSTFWPGIRDTEPLYYLSSVELDQQECITSRFQEKQTLLLAEDQPRAEGTPRVQRMEKGSAWLSGLWVSLCTWVTLI